MGLGLFSPTGTYPASVGHVGGNFGYVSWAGCLLDEGAVVVVLSNAEFEDISGMASPLVDAVIGRLTPAVPDHDAELHHGPAS